MAKNNKYLQYAKSRKTERIDINLQQIAVEYSRLLNKRFYYIFSGGIEIQFQFKMENFYHLLGFHKLTDVTAIQRIENHKMKKEDFFRFVKDGKITMDSTDDSILDGNEEKLVNIRDTKRKADFGEIKTHRFQFFSEKQILELLKNDPVIDFDEDGCDTVIDADKIFFKLIAEKNRNLNLFIGYDESARKHFVSTFFVEQEQNKFLIKRTGDSQPQLNILSRKVVDTQSNSLIEFDINWNNVRDEFANEPCYRGQKRLKTWISSKHITSAQVRGEIEIQCNLIEQYKKENEDLTILIEILDAIKRLNNPEEKEEAQLKLMDYDIDADNEEQIVSYKQYDFIEMKTKKQGIEGKLSAAENKLQNYKKFLPDIIELEILEIMKVYQPYLPEINFERNKLFEILGSNDIFVKILCPEDFMELYKKS